MKQVLLLRVQIFVNYSEIRLDKLVQVGLDWNGSNWYRLRILRIISQLIYGWALISQPLPRQY